MNNVVVGIEQLLKSPGYRYLAWTHAILSIAVSSKKLFHKVNLLKFEQFISVFIASSIYIFTMIFIVGGTDMKKWIEPAICLSLSIVPSLMKGKINYHTLLSLIGFAAGAYAFPLDWPVTWKEPPILNIFLMFIGGIIGSLVDFIKSTKINK